MPLNMSGMLKGSPVAPHSRRRLSSMTIARPKVNSSVSTGSRATRRRRNTASIVMPSRAVTTGEMAKATG